MYVFVGTGAVLLLSVGGSPIIRLSGSYGVLGRAVSTSYGVLRPVGPIPQRERKLKREIHETGQKLREKGWRKICKSQGLLVRLTYLYDEQSGQVIISRQTRQIAKTRSRKVLVLRTEYYVCTKYEVLVHNCNLFVYVVFFTTYYMYFPLPLPQKFHFFPAVAKSELTCREPLLRIARSAGMRLELGFREGKGRAASSIFSEWALWITTPDAAIAGADHGSPFVDFFSTEYGVRRTEY